MMGPEVFVSTASARNPRDLPEVLDRFLRAGISAIELSAPHPYLPRAEIESLLKASQDRGAKFILHNYFPAPKEPIVLNLAAVRDDAHEATLSLVRQALALAEETKSALYTCHAGYRAHATCPPTGQFKFKLLNVDSKLQANDRQRQSLAAILEIPAIRSGAVRFGIENLFPCESGGENVSYCCTPPEILEILDLFADQHLGLLLDLGHLSITATLLDCDPDQLLDELVELCGDRILEVHLSGNDGMRDLHHPLEPQAWQLQVLPRLAPLPGTGDGLFFTLEARGLSEDECLTQVDLIRSALS